MKNCGLFQSMLTSFVACNELMYDHCDECGDDGIPYTNVTVSKNSVSTATEEDDDSNALEESTLDNSTILTDTLQADWETITTDPIYRDLDEANSDIVHETLSAAIDRYRVSQTDDYAARHLSSPCNMMYTLSTSLGQDQEIGLAENKYRTPSTKWGHCKEEYIIDSIVSRSRCASGKAWEQQPLSSPMRGRSKSRDRTKIFRSRSRRLNRTRSLTRRSSQKRALARTRSAPRQLVRGRSICARMKRTGRFILSLRESQPTLKTGPCTRSNKCRGSSSLSKESHTSRDRDTSKQSGNKCSDKLFKNSRSRAERKPNRALARHSLASGRLNLQKETEEQSFVTRVQGNSPRLHGKSERIRDCDSLKTDDTSVCQRAERRLSELDKPKNESEIVFHPQILTVATKNMVRKATSLINMSIFLKQVNREPTLQNEDNIRRGIFAWRQIRGSRNERIMAKEADGQGTQDLFQILHIPAPSVSEDAPAQNADELEISGLAFPLPHEEGQEIAIQDNEHCYEDPANVHSMLTMPSLDLNILNDKGKVKIEAENDRSLIVALTGSEDSTLITDDGALS
jgi:hypothetical protein